MVRHKNAWLDTKYPTQHHQLLLPLSNTIPHLTEIVFPILFKDYLFRNPYRNENNITFILKYIKCYYTMWNLILLFICEDHDVCMNVYSNIHTLVQCWQFLDLIFQLLYQNLNHERYTQYAACDSKIYSPKTFVIRVSYNAASLSITTPRTQNPLKMMWTDFHLNHSLQWITNLILNLLADIKFLSLYFLNASRAGSRVLLQCNNCHIIYSMSAKKVFQTNYDEAQPRKTVFV